MLTVLVAAGAFTGRSTTVNFTLAPAAIEPMEQVTVPAPVVQPGEAHTYDQPDGMVSAMVTPVPALGPWLVALTVKITSLPVKAPPMFAVIVPSRSTGGVVTTSLANL